MNNLPPSEVSRPGFVMLSSQNEETKIDAARLLARRNAEVMALGVGLPMAGAASARGPASSNALPGCFPNFDPHMQMVPVSATSSAVTAPTPTIACSPVSTSGSAATVEVAAVQFDDLIQRGGIPIQIASCCSQPSSNASRAARNSAVGFSEGPEFIAVRFPQQFSMSEFVPPVSVTLEADQLDLIQDEAASSMLIEESNPKSFMSNHMRNTGSASTASQSSENPRIVWRVEDAGHKQLLGRRLGIDPSTYFVMLEKNEQGVIEIMPVASWYGLVNNRQATRRAAGSNVAAGEVSNSDLAERKRRVAIQEEARADARLRSRLGVVGSAEDNATSWSTGGGPGGGVFQRDAANYEEVVYSEDAGLSRQAIKRSKAILKARRGTVRFDNDDDESLAGSALHIGVVKRSAVDWDWDGDGKATDDEEDGGVEAEDAENDDDVVKGGGGDFRGSDEESEANLSKFGQQMTTALESQVQQDADDELAQFSDDEEETEESSAASALASGSGATNGASFSGAESGGGSTQGADGPSGSATSSGTPRSAKPAVTGSSNSDSGTSVSKGSAGSKSGTGPTPRGVVRERGSSSTTGPRVKRQNTGTTAPSPSDRLTSGKSASGASSSAGESHISAEAVRQRVIRTLNLHGGRMATKEFIQSFNITSNTSELFKLIRAAINDVCEVHTENHAGIDVKILELQAQYQQT